MCNKNSSPPSDSQSKQPMPLTKEPTDSLITPRRRRMPRKRKFRSLSLQLSANPSDQRRKKNNQSKRMKHENEQQQQLNLFPLHPENLVEDKDPNMQEENDVALIFSSDGGATLNGLLEGDYSTTTTTTATTRTTTTASEEDSFSPPSMTCRMSDGGDNGSWLVRKAMRGREKERDESEERWVCYSEVTSYCNSTASGGGAAASTMDRESLSWFEEKRGKVGGDTTAFGVLSLKLDYEGILNAWSDKGPLHVPPETPQTVPDWHNNAANVPWDGAAENLWKVPEYDGTSNIKKMKVKEEMGDKLGQREASVLRYKEKRRSRLFSKRIRYEVRKLNAEKRPRMKGRFVRRD